MAARFRRNAIPLSLSAIAFAMAILQRPGWSSSDTKIDLHTDPIRFLGDIAHLWSPSSGLGGVESAQYAGYLFPMGPFFAVGHWLGLSDWLVDRLWLGLLLAVGSWGMVRLADTLGAARTRAAAAAAGLLYLLNPYVVVFSNRTSITLLAYALLPWLVLIAWRGVRAPKSWRLAAIFALLVTASGGGVNAAVVALALLAPIAIAFFEAATRAVTWKAVWSFAWRCGATTFAASLWWIAPAAAQAKYGVDFLRFTEPAGAIWATTSLSESFRAMGYWISYIGVGFNGVVRPYFSDAGTLLFNHVVTTATLLVPGTVLFAFAWTRRRRYAAYFLLLILGATLLMAIGFPEGTPLRKGATYTYNHFAGLRFLRTTYKAGPLVILGVAGLGAMTVDFAAKRFARGARVALAVAGVAVIALAAWPLMQGRAVDKQVSWKKIPSGWTRAAHDLDRSLGDNARAAVLPGQLYAFYKWGGTVDPILPSLTKKPVAVRNAVPYGDLRGTDLLWTTDALVQQGRTLPGQLSALLRLMSVRKVIAATDDDVNRSGVVDPQAAVRTLARSGLTQGAAYSPSVRSFGVPPGRTLVRVEPRSSLTVVDGSADGLATMAGSGALSNQDPLTFAGDLSAAQVRDAAKHGGTITVSDSNRRRVFVVSRMQQNAGWTLGADTPISEDAATLNPFPERGPDGETVSVVHGANSISAPFSPGYPQFPEHRPFAAFDGNPRTAWFGDRALDPERHTITIDFGKPRDVAAIRVLPRNEAGARTTAIVANGKRFQVGEGWQTLPVDLHGVKALTLKVVAAKTGSASGGGLAEVEVPGVKVTESLRPPVLAERALKGADTSHATLQYAFSRASGDNPLKHSSSYGVQVKRPLKNASTLEQLRVQGAGDEEVGIDRMISPPSARDYDAKAWLSTTPEGRDSDIDKLVGAKGDVVADGSARFEGRPGWRASSALDGEPATAWEAPWSTTDQPWIRIQAKRPFTLRELQIEPAQFPASLTPTRVRLEWPGGHAEAPVVGGRVKLLRPVRTDRVTMRIIDAKRHLAKGASGSASSGGASSGSASSGGASSGSASSGSAYASAPSVPGASEPRPRSVDAVGIGELRIPGLAHIRVPRSGTIGGCDAVSIRASDGSSAGLRVDGDIADLDAGRPLRATSCSPLRLAAGSQRVQVPPRVLRADHLLLTSPAPDPIARIAVAPGGVVDPGDPGHGRRDNVKLDVNQTAWLVLGESFDRGWRAWCDEKPLGEPVPIDGYANGWPVEPGCRTARFAFAPQKGVHVVQLLSALACLVLLAIAVLGRRVALAPEDDELPAEAPTRVPLLRAAVIGLVVGAVLAFCFSLRSGVLIAPAVALTLWRAIPAKPLALAGGLLLALAVPLDYILFPADDFGGFNPGYAGDQVSGHWIAVAAWVLLFLALWRTLSTATRRRRGPSGEPAAAAE